MDKRGRKKKRMKNNICIYSGKPIGNNDAVLVEHARDYLRKLGYLVSHKAYILFLLIPLILFSFPFISSYGTFLNTNFSSTPCNEPTGIDSNGTFIWVGDYTYDGICKYYMNGTYINKFAFSSLNNNTYDIAQDGTYFYVADLTDSKIYIYFMNGTYNTSFSTTGTSTWGIDYYNNFLYISRTNNILKYYTNGTYVGVSKDLTPEGIAPYGITNNGTNFFVLDSTTKKVSKYFINWTFTGINFSVSQSPVPQSIAQNGTNFFILSYTEDKWLLYDFGAGCSENLVNTSWSDWVNMTPCSSYDTLIQNRSRLQYDNNFCNVTQNITFWDYTNIPCNYCSYYPINITLNDWFDVSYCINNTKFQNSTILTYDYNFDVCYNITGLESDFFENITYNLMRDISCIDTIFSDTSLLQIDLESKTTILILVFMFIFALLLFYFKQYIFSGGILIVVGFILLFSSFNIILSFIIIAGGVVICFL